MIMVAYLKNRVVQTYKANRPWTWHVSKWVHVIPRKLNLMTKTFTSVINSLKGPTIRMKGAKLESSFSMLTVSHFYSLTEKSLVS